MSSQFVDHFRARADLAEELYTGGFRAEAYLVATVALDALAAIWEFHEPPLSKYRRASVRLVRFFEEFCDAVCAEKIAVVFFAEDMLANANRRLHPLAERLLDRRAASRSRTSEMEFRASPLAHLDCAWRELLSEEPSLASEKLLAEIAIEYRYPALLYRLFRCGPAHAMLKGSRTHDFSRGVPDKEISYFPEWVSGGIRRPISIKFGIGIVADWLRTSVTNFARHCDDTGIKPAAQFDPSAESLERLSKLWKPLA